MSVQFPKPPLPEQKQPMPGRSDSMDPPPDYGEDSYHGSGRLAGKKAVITGADSGIGRAVALAFAREGADILVSYYDEHEDARQTKRLVESTGRQCILVSGDIKDPTTAASSSQRPPRLSAASIFWSTTQLTRQALSPWKRSVMKSGR